MSETHKLVAVFVLGAVSCTDDVATAPGLGEVGQEICVPAPPLTPAMCRSPEPIIVPPVNHLCTFELRVTELSFLTGQGWFEDRAEANARFTATNLDTGAQIVGEYPGPGSTIKMEVDTSHILNIPLGSYTVSDNDPNGLDVRVCGNFTEKDFLLNPDDIGQDCKTVHLVCPQASSDQVLFANLCKSGNCNKLRGAMSAKVEVERADADGDCVVNPLDFTPEPCDEANKGQLCRASLVYFHYGDGFLNDLAQNLGTDLEPALTGYDRTVLLIDDAQIGPFNLNPAAITAADVVMLPTEQNYFAALRDLTARGCDIDVWMFSHGWPIWRTAADNTVFTRGGHVSAYADDDGQGDPDITTDELLAATNPAVSGTPSVPVRMTYGTPCYYEEWNAAWLRVGAKVTSGAIDINFVPNFYDNFVASWNTNQTYGTSLATELGQFEEDLAFTFIDAQGAAWAPLCIGSVLELNNCAFDFFTDIDASFTRDANGDLPDGPDEGKYCIGGPRADLAGIAYDGTLSGADNMRASSAKTQVGDAAITKSTAGLVWP